MTSPSEHAHPCPGTLYLIPVPLGDTAPEACLPALTLTTTRRLRHFVVENAKTARAHLKNMGMEVPLNTLSMEELSEHTQAEQLPHLLTPLDTGHDIGLMSEAGCPGVADPGAALVALAHRRGLRVVPLTGPSSVLLALMASGLDSQRFSFHGYLPAREPERSQHLRHLEQRSASAPPQGEIQIFIETPYRNTALFSALRDTLKGDTRLCIACDLTGPGEHLVTRTVSDWRACDTDTLDLERRPAIFLLLATPERPSSGQRNAKASHGAGKGKKPPHGPTAKPSGQRRK